MIVAAAQPYFAPHPGYFARAMLSDVLVLLDSVQFPQRTSWMTRNRFKSEQGVLWATVPVRRKNLGLQKISDVRIDRGRPWSRKLLRSLRECYGRAPFFEEHLPFLEELLRSEPERLLDFNLAILMHLKDRLGAKARVMLLSQLGIEAREPELTVNICRSLGADTFLAPRPARKFLDERALAEAGVEARFFARRTPVYPQLYGPFIHDLSAFDLLFTCGPKAPEILRRSIAHER